MGKHLGEHRRRQDILGAAKSLFVKKGFAATSLADIAEAAGISRGGMYFYYRNKEEILGDLCEQEVEASVAYLSKALEVPASNPHLTLQAILAYYIKYLVENPDSTAISQLLMDVSLRNEDIHKILARNMQQLEKMITLLLKESGIMREGPLAGFGEEKVAVLISTLVEGVKARYLLTRDAKGVQSTVEILSRVAFTAPAATKS